MPSHHSYDAFDCFFYISQVKGIGGLIKAVPQDFIVGEIVNSSFRLDPRSSFFPSLPNRGLFLHCVLIKCGWTTEDALNYLAKLWHIPRKNIGFAGTKDKNAWTAQRISVWGVKEKFEKGLLKKINTDTLKIHFLGFDLHDIRLGDLLGNFFEITIRNVELNENEIMTRINGIMADVKKFGGLPNFFGPQRFGESRPITHLVGKFIILNDFRSALRYYIGLNFNDDKEASRARKIFWDTEDAHEALRIFPKRLKFERKLLKLLIETNYDYAQVFNRLSLQLRKLFVHAYQSYLFNNYLHIRYFEYSPDFTRPLEGEKVSNQSILAPMFGTDIVLEGQAKEIYLTIFDKENFDQSILYDKRLKRLGLRGTYRPILFVPKNFKLLHISKDELYHDKLKVRLSFDLDKGSYATVFLRELMKN